MIYKLINSINIKNIDAILLNTMKYFSCLFIYIFSLLGFSQDFVSLKQLANTIENDSTYSLIQAEKHFIQKNYNRTVNICKTIIKNDKTDIENSRCFELLGESYRELGEYYKSIDYFKRVIELHKNNNKKLLSNYISISKTNKKIENKKSYRECVNYTLKALAITKQKVVSTDTLHMIHNNLGNYYKRLGDFKKANTYHKKALTIAQENNNNRLIHLSFINLGVLTINTNGINSTPKELQLTNDYYNKALKYDSIYATIIYKNLGTVSSYQGNPKEAIEYYNKALGNLLKTKIVSLNSNPNFKDIEYFYNKEDLQSILLKKCLAWIKYFEQENNKNYLKYALETIELSDKILDKLLNELTEEKTKLLWRDQASSFYSLGVHTSHLLKNTEKAFYFTEKNKALLLLNNTVALKIKSIFPEKIIAKETQIKKEITRLQLVINTNKADSLQKKIFNQKRILEVFSDSLKTVFPEYRNIYKKRKLYTVKEIQKDLDINTTCVSYIWNKTENRFDALYGVFISKDTSKVFKIKNLSDFNKKVTNFRNVVSKPFKTKNDIIAYQKIAYNLYKELFPLEIQESIKHKKILIIPDNDLQSIPFEALITKENTNQYLIETNNISYAYSFSFLKENNSITRKPKNNFAGFAPVNFNYDNLMVLNNSYQEISEIKKLVNGKTYTNNNASKDFF